MNTDAVMAKDIPTTRPKPKLPARLLGNGHLHAEREHLHAAMARWLVRSDQPVIIVDWSDLKADGSWHLLRAAIPVGGRTLTVLDMAFPAGLHGQLE